MSLPKKLKLQCWSPAIEGDGANLTVTFAASQLTRANSTHRTFVFMDVDRSFIHALCNQIAAMQERDLQRIKRETARLQTEIAPLVKHEEHH